MSMSAETYSDSRKRKKCTSDDENVEINDKRHDEIDLCGNNLVVYAPACPAGLPVIKIQSQKIKLKNKNRGKEVKNFLSSLIFPIPVENFINDGIYQHRVFVNTHGTRDRFRWLVNEYLFGLDLLEMMEESASADEGIFVWMKDAGTGKLQSFQTSPANALVCYNSGSASLYFRSPQRMADDFASALSDSVGMDFAGRFLDKRGAKDVKAEIEIFVTKSGNSTDWHFDFQENWTLQLKGRKKWLVRKGMSNPIRGYTPHYNKDVDVLEQQMKIHKFCDSSFSPVNDSEGFRESDYEEVIVSEGSVFYHPAGIWHRVECLEDSVSINISLISSTWADILSEASRQLLWKCESTRKYISLPFDNSQQIDLSKAYVQIQEAIDLQKSFLDELRPADILPRACLLGQPKLISITSASGIENRMEVIPCISPMESLTEDSILRINPLSVLFPSSSVIDSNLRASIDQRTLSDAPKSYRYVVHVGFAGDDLHSNSRVEISVDSPTLANAIEWISSLKGSEASKFSAKAPLDPNLMLRITWGQLCKVYDVLNYAGFISLH